jgi:uncharacterized membrane protein YeaQ/YmgE (transglycosylase-associated protein family)
MAITIILGIVGAFVGGLLEFIFSLGRCRFFLDFRSWILAIGGALIVLWIYGMLTKKANLIVKN